MRKLIVLAMIIPSARRLILEIETMSTSTCHTHKYTEPYCPNCAARNDIENFAEIFRLRLVPYSFST